MAHWNGAEPRHRVTDAEAQKENAFGKSIPSSRETSSRQYHVTDGRTALGTVELVDGGFIAIGVDACHASGFVVRQKTFCERKDAGVVCSIALQYGAPVEVIRKALMRDSQGRASGPLGAALDLLLGDEP